MMTNLVHVFDSLTNLKTLSIIFNGTQRYSPDANVTIK